MLGLYLCKRTLESFSDMQTDIHNVDGVRMTERELVMYYVVRLLVSLPFMVVAGLLAWRCNSGESMVLRVLITVLAALFSTIYIMFYLIYRVLLKHPCK